MRGNDETRAKQEKRRDKPEGGRRTIVLYPQFHGKTKVAGLALWTHAKPGGWRTSSSHLEYDKIYRNARGTPTVACAVRRIESCKSGRNLSRCDPTRPINIRSLQ